MGPEMRQILVDNPRRINLPQPQPVFVIGGQLEAGVQIAHLVNNVAPEENGRL
jgi:hypothetical protein